MKKTAHKGRFFNVNFEVKSSKKGGIIIIKDLTGQKFGRLTAVKYVGKNKWGQSTWLFCCDCGTEKVLSANPVTQGKSRSCGCLDREKHQTHPNRKTHGECGMRLHRIWKAMKNRCHNPNAPDYQKWYGSKGVQVCDEWYYNYWIFRNWSICHGYKDNLSIDRIDPYGDYEPSNCRWATALVQAHNKREGGGHHPSS